MAKYPTIFCHGFCGWGENDGIYKIVPYWGIKKSRNALDFLKINGYECYAPSLGPWASAWDRACELWAIINGGTVDYGKVHSQKFGHQRYGRTYEKGLLNNQQKFNLIGHSFGGPTVRMLSFLMEYGFEEEITGTSANDISPLFLGGNGARVNSVVTLAGVNNGSGFASWLRRPGVVIINSICLLANALIAETPFTHIIDLHTEYWNVMPTYKGGFRVRLTKDKLRAIARYNKNKEDSIGHEMQIEGMRTLNKTLSINPKAYHFAYSGCRTHDSGDKDGHHVPNDDMSLICKIPQKLTGSFIGKTGIDKTWFANDGFVNVKGAMAPLDEPSTDIKDNIQIYRGIWYNMSLENKDHLSYIGVGEYNFTYQNFIKSIIQKIENLD